jgi:hypothetical protein
MEQKDEDKRAEVALMFAGQESETRQKLIMAVNSFFEGLQIAEDMPALSESERKKLIALSMFTVRCRSAVERENYQSREIQLIPGVESPTRIVKVFALLFRGLLNIGVIRGRAWKLIESVAFSSMPALRGNVLSKMLKQPENHWVTSTLATELGYPTTTTRRTLEDMTCYGIIERESQGEGKADIWKLSRWTIDMHKAAFIDLTRNSESIYTSDEPPITNSQNSQDRISGKVGCQPLGGANSENPGELPDCPKCGKWDWTFNSKGQPVCSCRYVLEANQWQ